MVCSCQVYLSCTPPTSCIHRLVITFHLIIQGATKILARQLVRLRQQIANLQASRAQMRGIATHTQVRCENPLSIV